MLFRLCLAWSLKARQRQEFGQNTHKPATGSRQQSFTHSFPDAVTAGVMNTRYVVEQ